MARHRHSAGVTLLEVIVALAIVALLAGIAIPRIDRTPAALVEQAARVVAGDVRLTRIRAIAGGRRARLVVFLHEGRIEHAVETDDGWESRGTQDLPDGVDFDPAASTRVSDGKVTITFYPHGLTADNGTIVLAGGELRRRVVVNQAGRVRVE